MTNQPNINGFVFLRGEDGYEEARQGTVWNARTAERFPDAIVRAADEDDVIEALAWARDRNWKVGLCSGGHSWNGSHLRDGGLLIELAALNEANIDTEQKRAIVGPGVRGSELLPLLESEDLFFPVGHCQGVALGGYLLQGGFGWLGRAYGPACENVVAIEAITADGERVFADAETNSELFWAARGAGPGFFAVVTKFHLQLHDLLPHAMNSITIYPIDAMDEIFRWADEIGPRVHRNLEMMIFMLRPEHVAGHDRVVMVTGPVVAATEQEALDALAILDTCPVRDRAIEATGPHSVRIVDMVAASAVLFPPGNRFAVDNMWTSASADDLLEGLHEIADTLPPEPSHAMWMNWGPSPERQDMAYSVEDRTYIALYTSWSEAAQDEQFADWPTARMKAMEPHASGIQLADENLVNRPARFVATENERRLVEVRGKWDPDSRFHSWMNELA